MQATCLDIRREDWLRQRLSTDERILDIGSNKGHVFQDFWADFLVSVDVDMYSFPGFVRANAQQLPFNDKSFDTAILAEILEHVVDPVQCLSEARRVAGRLLSTIPNEWDWDKECKPFTSIEEREEETGLGRLELFKKGNPEAREFYEYDDGKHGEHCRYYDEKMVREHFLKAGWEIQSIEDTKYDGFAFFLVEAK